MAMFGLLASGRMVQTDFQMVGEKQFLVTIPDADNVNHVVVFLTGNVPFPDGYSGLVYFSWPDPNRPPNWQLLGFLSNNKPSSIFKISQRKRSEDAPTLQQSGFLAFAQHKISHDAQVGVSIETTAVVEQQMQLLNIELAKNQTQMMEFSQKMMENFLNYVSGFVISPSPTEAYVPMNVVENWYRNFERKLQLNPYFWKNT